MTIVNPVACLINVLIGDASPEALPSSLDSLKNLGYTHVVLGPMDPATPDAPVIKQLFAERGLSPITIFGGQSPETSVGSEDADVRAAGLASMKATVDLTVALGGTQMNGVPYGVFGKPYAPAPAGYFARAAREVGKAAEYAHERGVTMTFEVLNRYETSLINTAVQAMDFAELSESEHLKIHLDTFHMAVEEADMFAAITHALPRLGYLELGQSGRGKLGTGVVDPVAVVSHALKAGYTGPLGVEAFTRTILPGFVSDALAIWREPYTYGLSLASEAVELIQQGVHASKN
ncbi:sugar phosphate isomerase/epimerase family protein [Aurantimicrobium minutum]|uniref:sugar phosphate isomerase/epimerase family protein n=1 Tax=Aurantimicrobium minutum TaxID=708131 RepID=UPI0024754F38|nr:sugar phosphate isomerase/epimerase family protein [Aurantimicrobium minutum]MDH6423035.1 D-psicose/D-tagatose/L-ribulose 3-epimerase [Aurantimicrobium minutum]